METPSSTRRVTRSQTAKAAASAGNNNSILSKKFEESEKATARQNKHQDRSALVDITNDSPIVGLAMGSFETPSSAMSKKRMINQGQCARTPGSGEALLRGQVKTLLQKVEEEAELSKMAVEDRPFFNLQGLGCSPMNLIAPTPANTPQVLNFSDAYDLPCLTASPVSEKLLIPQMINGMFDEKKEKGMEGEDLITRSLMLDFSDKWERSDSLKCSSEVTCEGASKQGVESGEDKLSTYDDNSSVWSIQVNLSSPRNDDELEEEEEGENSVGEDEEYECYDDEKEGHGFGGDDDGLLDELCEGMCKISVKEGPKFSGKHVRFLYNSDDKLQGEEEVCGGGDEYESPNVPLPRDGSLHLKGLPTPKGKHLRFPEELED